MVTESSNKIDPAWAWAPYQPSARVPWDAPRVGHLYRRAAFGVTWPEMDAALQTGPQKTVDALLKGGPGVDDFERLMAPLAQSLGRANSGAQASAWWLYRILYGPHPLREKMTLFWHNHFATSNAKVQNARFMLRQYDLLHRLALDSFADMVREMAYDPAMMVWLDTRFSKKGMPNENYARELMELFTLGIGNYTENDIREAARAFTGWDIREGEKVVFNATEHDGRVKTVLGQKGAWQAADIARICLEQPSTAFFIVGKLYRFLVNEMTPPTHELLQPLVLQYRASHFDTGQLVATILKSNLFFAETNYRARVKPPVDFAVGTVHALEGRLGTTALAGALQDLGQNLFYPPSVKGWDGGTTWLNGQTLLSRHNLALAVTSTEDSRFGRRTDPAAIVRKYGKKERREQIDFFLRLFVQGDVPATTKSRLVRYDDQALRQHVPVYWTGDDANNHRIRALCHLVLTLPEYELS